MLPSHRRPGPHQIRNNCRLCLCEDLFVIFSLPNTPLANELYDNSLDSINAEIFPLQLVCCGDCGHIQLPIVVDPDRLFRDYKYVSGTSFSFTEHFRKYSNSVVKKHGILSGSLVLDIGSNDGTLLKFFQRLGMRVLGVDPANSISKKATDDGIPTINGFFNPRLAEDIYNDYSDEFSLITANNVFAHVDDIRGMAFAVRRLLRPDGVFIFEVQYLSKMVENGYFDMIYHEHLSYHHLTPLISFFESIGMCLFDAEVVFTHGGSIRCHVSHTKKYKKYAGRDEVYASPTSNLNELLDLEADYLGKFPHPVALMSHEMEKNRRKLARKLSELKRSGKTVVGYGAPAKATTLIHTLNLSNMIDYVVDDNCLKHDLYIPGTNIQIRDPHIFSCGPVDCIVILAWNFAESILDKIKRDPGLFLNDDGIVLVPLPEIEEHTYDSLLK